MSIASSFNERASQTAREASVQSKHERVTRYAQKQYERCGANWAAQYYTRLLGKEGNAPALQPSWAINDRKPHLLRAASALARLRHDKNIQRIDKAAARQVRGRSKDVLQR